MSSCAWAYWFSRSSAATFPHVSPNTFGTSLPSPSFPAVEAFATSMQEYSRYFCATSYCPTSYVNRASLINASKLSWEMFNLSRRYCTVKFWSWMSWFTSSCSSDALELSWSPINSNMGAASFVKESISSPICSFSASSAANSSFPPPAEERPEISLSKTPKA